MLACKNLKVNYDVRRISDAMSEVFSQAPFKCRKEKDVKKKDNKTVRVELKPSQKCNQPLNEDSDTDFFNKMPSEEEGSTDRSAADSDF